MRQDMGRCVIESPRRNSSAPSVKARWYGRFVEDEEGVDYDGMTHLPVSRKQEGYHPKIGYKSFTDVLGPINGYLKSSVGRNWDDVYSELANGLGRGPWGVRHILYAHIYVATNTYYGLDGKIWNMGKHGPEVVNGSYSTEYYVEPGTRILRRHPDARKRWDWRDKNKITRETLYKVSAGKDLWYVRVNGLWFLGRYEDAAAEIDHSPPRKGYYIGKAARYADPEWPDIPRGWGATIQRFVKMKSCSKKEIKALLKKRDAELANGKPK